MININSTTVAVETSAELKSILEADNTIATIYFANDITLESGISILGTKQSITIDGLYPLDGTGTIHTYTDMNSASDSSTIGVRTASSINILFKNMNVIGRNYYGIIFVSESTNHQDVVITYENVTYSGPQITYHPSGLSIYKNLNVNIVASTACPANEVAEIAKLQIGGNTTITHNSTSDSTFWLRGNTNDAYIKILDGANVSITTAKDLIYSKYYVALSISKDATFTINTKYGLFRDSSHQASSITVDENATFSVIQQAANGSYSTIYCREAFNINSNATVYIQANYTNTAPLVRFTTSSSQLNITDPKSVIFYNSSYACLYFTNSTVVNINCRKIDYWLTSPTLITPGKIDGAPLYSWYKSTEDLISISATASSSKTTITTNNFTQEELETLPSIDLLQLQTAKTLRFLPAGNLTLESAPSLIEFQRPVISTNPTILGRKDNTSNITVIDTRSVSSTWYIYAYITEPLTTNDSKHTLNNSLIFIDENNITHTLSTTPTLIYTGSPNDGSSKTTTITWENSFGILFKVIDSIYANKKYSTKIKWILTDSKL